MSDYIDLLGLEKHEEGGYFAVVYRSESKVIPLSDRYTQSVQESSPIERYSGSSIYFLLENQAFSAWHRLKSDEVWHYYDGGSPIDIYIIDQSGHLRTYMLGNPSLIEDASFQVIIKAGVWFAAEVRDKSSFGLAGCTVSPAFEDNDFELAIEYRDQLVELYPEHENLIDKFIEPHNMETSECQNFEVTSPKINKLSANDYIRKLKLERHIEGGYFGLNYKSTDMVIPLDQRYKLDRHQEAENFESPQRHAGSSIYFLLDKEDFSAWHQLRSDEIWHYYDGGSPIDIHVIDHEGRLRTYILGNPLSVENASFQVVIKAGVWFAAEVRDKKSFGLVGCTVSPAFEYEDFILANKKDLAVQYPEHETIINKFSEDTSSSKTWVNKVIDYASFALTSGIGFYSSIRNSESLNTYINNFRIKKRT